MVIDEIFYTAMDSIALGLLPYGMSGILCRLAEDKGRDCFVTVQESTNPNPYWMGKKFHKFLNLLTSQDTHVQTFLKVSVGFI